jgi:2-oxo-4-hydroxy-4-carboxy--5-ureidoimidazoline (OHCU) decarboxylase/N-acetylglutamate synthase-like GNAT family acetyltransferase
MALEVRDFESRDHEWASRLIGASQAGDHRVARLGELLDPLAQEGIVAEQDGRPVGLLTVHETDRGLEVLSLHSQTRGIGAGTRLLETALRVAAASDAPRLWLVTTNDNLDAIRWYLRRGMTVAAIHREAVDHDRHTLKPALPAINPANGIPIRDLIELETRIGDGEDLRFREFPRIEDLDALPPEPAAHLLGPLFEEAPRFLARLAEQRPFGDDVSLIARAHDLARGLPEDEQIELLNAHPRIGADPATVSGLSHAEQGYDEAAPRQEPWIAEELEALNEAYERVFGFRFVVFVAGRPRSAIVPILETSLRDERISELRRGLDDVVHIAADRLATLRARSAGAVADAQPAATIGA